MRKGSPIVRPATVSVRIGKPVETRGMDVSNREQLADEVRSRVEELLALGPLSRQVSVRLQPDYLAQVSSRREHFNGLPQAALFRDVTLGRVDPGHVQASVRRCEALEKLPGLSVLPDRLLDVCGQIPMGAMSTTGRPSGLRSRPAGARRLADFSAAYRLMFADDQLLSAFLGVNLRAYRSSSMRLMRLSIQP